MPLIPAGTGHPSSLYGGGVGADSSPPEVEISGGLIPKYPGADAEMTEASVSVTPPESEQSGSSKTGSALKIPDVSSPDDMPSKRKRGRPRKYPLDPNSPAVKTPSTKLPPNKKTESKSKDPMTPARTSMRTQIKKSISVPELEEPKVKIPKQKPALKKVSKPMKSLDDSLEIRKFGYKGSKVFKKFLELNFDKIVDERPDLSAKDVEKYIEDLWLRKTDAARQK